VSALHLLTLTLWYAITAKPPAPLYLDSKAWCTVVSVWFEATECWCHCVSNDSSYDQLWSVCVG